MIDTTDQYYTQAIESQLLDQFGDPVGHILMADMDRVGSLYRVQSIADRFRGLSMIFRSSKHSYHLYNLSVMPFEDQLDRIRRIDPVDDSFVSLSEDRGKFVLRIAAKKDMDTADPIKPQPKFVAAKMSGSPNRISIPHLRQLQSVAGIDDIPTPVADSAIDGRIETRIYHADYDREVEYHG